MNREEYVKELKILYEIAKKNKDVGTAAVLLQQIMEVE